MSVRKTQKKPNVAGVLQPGTNLENRHIADLESLGAIVTELKKEKLRVVLTQGVFDLIHEGHAKYLEMAKSYGDILIVGVDSDELTKIRKGKNRPIVPQEERIEMLVHLRHVDLVVLREAKDETGDLIRLVKHQGLYCRDGRTVWRILRQHCDSAPTERSNNKCAYP
jgi:D-beta-D-heptose 7-phosphate kinase/D-beta-D-heptose 1-phosphate adenosyltransferase